MSQNSGDIIAMELLENKFLGVFYLLGKKKYYNFCLNQIKKRYGDIEYGNLQEMRVNSICCYKDDNMHNMYSLHVLNELMENVNL